MLATGRFRGAPMPAHIRIPDIRPTHFARWLHLFRQAAVEICPPEAAQAFVTRAEMIAESLQFGMAASRGQLPPVQRPAAETRGE
jgi:hemoglobin